MIAKAIEKIEQMAKPFITDINGSTYASKNMYRIDTDLRADPIGCKTLTGLIDYIKANVDNFNGWHGYFLHVVNETTVELVSELDNDRRREKIIVAKADVSKFDFGYFMGSEEFTIGVQAKFADTEDRAAVLRFAGTAEDGTVTAYSDDGVTQKATVKKGISFREEKKVPSPCKLRPYRTFVEVEQPVSTFIFRMKSTSSGIDCALYEADGGAWKMAAMGNIAKWLENALEIAGVNIHVIA